MFVIRNARGVQVGEPFGSLGEAKGRVGNGTVWYRWPVERVVETQFLHRKDKVSRVRGKVASARVGGEHTAVLVHKVTTGEWQERRVW